MQYTITISGVSPIVFHNGATGLDTRSQLSRDIAALMDKRAALTEAEEDRLRELECQRSLWLDESGAPTIPPAALRAAIEGGARKRRQGSQVRGGLVVLSTGFRYDWERYGETVEELGRRAQFVVPVVLNRSRVLRTRAKFDPPWVCVSQVEVDTELVNEDHLREWLEIAGKQIGIGNWRPERSGTYGRFELASLERA